MFRHRVIPVVEVREMLKQVFETIILMVIVPGVADEDAVGIELRHGLISWAPAKDATPRQSGWRPALPV